MQKNKKCFVSVSTEPLKSLQDFLNYDKELFQVADFIHCDVMDGKFVNRNLLEFDLLKEYAQKALLGLDIHLMSEIDEEYVKKFLSLKPKMLTVHFEALENKQNLINILKLIRENGAKAGVSLKPQTQAEALEDVLNYIDLILIMSVEIGYGGQVFIESTYEKIEKTKHLIKLYNKKILISVDGGVNGDNAKKLASHGADILVSGSFVFKAKDRKKAVFALKG
ncbi:MAG: ribulose-phosphate 3-epimerase [Christensenellales bacterium]|jgi:ribulose-phosphate 3-epimerase